MGQSQLEGEFPGRFPRAMGIFKAMGIFPIIIIFSSSKQKNSIHFSLNLTRVIIPKMHGGPRTAQVLHSNLYFMLFCCKVKALGLRTQKWSHYCIYILSSP